jgi:hypothetical protein
MMHSRHATPSNDAPVSTDEVPVSSPAPSHPPAPPTLTLMRPRSLLALLPALFACLPTAPADTTGGADTDSTDSTTADTTDGDTEVRTVIGPQGGVVEGLGLQLDIPADALTEDVEIVIRTEPTTEIPGVTAVSPVYCFEPEGLVFARQIAVSIDVDTDDYGTLYWSVLDSPDSYEPAGIALGGVAIGYTHHFSTAVVGNGGCEDPNGAGESYCGCRATDEVEDLLCPTDPTADGGACPGLQSYSGTDGSGCSGYGPRYETTYACFCLTSDGDYLCPEAHILGPMQQCPSEGGLGGHYVDEPMGSCSGTTVVFDPMTGESMNESKSGMLVDCSPVYGDPEYESTGGVLEGCIQSKDGHDGASCTIGDGGGPAQPAIAGACKDRVQMIKDTKMRTTACAKPMGANDLWHANIGTEIGNMIETTRWATSSVGSEGTPKLRQVKIPFGSKSECYNQPDERTSPGFLDLVEVVRRDEVAKEVVIRYAEIKPLSQNGLADGRSDLACYKKRIIEAGSKCAELGGDNPPALEEYVDFCAYFGAIGWTVKLDADPYLFRQPGLEEPVPYTFTTAPGGMTNLTIITCEPGLVTYYCQE